ncbi:MAG: hypothetical protein M3065_15595 [Actinomycetota bacterium]|nr:hypothetical protein [Actinomycetota bacterium]
MWRPELGDYVVIAGVVLGASSEQLRRLPNLHLAESALAAPFAGFGEVDAYPTLELEAAVLLERSVAHHPLTERTAREGRDARRSRRPSATDGNIHCR